MKYSKETLTNYAPKVYTITDLIRKITSKETVCPSSINLVSKKLKEFNIDTSHFTGSVKSISNLKREQKSYKDVLAHSEEKTNRTNRKTLQNAISKEGSIQYICAICGNIGAHNGKPLSLHIDHIDGNWKNNTINNLRYLCPNCHSQTSTFGFTGKVKY